jgi:hypothetical protein
MFENIDIQYSNAELFSENHIKSTKIIEKIRQGKVQEVLNGIGHIKDRGIVIDVKYLKHFANQYTYDIITCHFDNIFSQILNYHDTYSIYVNFQSFSLTDIEKHYTFCKNMATYFSEKYPDKLYKCYIYNTSFIFESLLKIIGTFIDKDTLNKMLLVRE